MAVSWERLQSHQASDGGRSSMRSQNRSYIFIVISAAKSTWAADVIRYHIIKGGLTHGGRTKTVGNTRAAGASLRVAMPGSQRKPNARLRRHRPFKMQSHKHQNARNQRAVATCELATA
jgi:hypothetical protein